LSIRSGGRSSCWLKDDDARIFEIAKFASFIFFLNFSFEILKLHFYSVVHISVVHILLGEKARLSLSLLALILHKPLPCLLVFYRPLVCRCSDIAKLGVLKVTFADARLCNRGGPSITINSPPLLSNEVVHRNLPTRMLLLVIADRISLELLHDLPKPHLARGTVPLRLGHCALLLMQLSK
jgi:hypothetical protein